MKNITGFYCKQPSLLLNTERKGYKISHRLLPPVPPAPPCSARTQKMQWSQTCPGAEAGAWCGCGKGGKILGVQPCMGHPALGKRCLLPSAGYQFSNKSLDKVSRFYLPFAANKSHFGFFSLFIFFFFSWFFFFPFFLFP